MGEPIKPGEEEERLVRSDYEPNEEVDLVHVRQDPNLHRVLTAHHAFRQTELLEQLASAGVGSSPQIGQLIEALNTNSKASAILAARIDKLLEREAQPAVDLQPEPVAP